jgi:hypothetical protein
MGCACSQTRLSGRSVCIACLHRVRDLLHVVTNILDRRPLNRSDTTAQAAAVSRLSEPNDRPSSPLPSTQGAFNLFEVRRDPGWPLPMRSSEKVRDHRRHDNRPVPRRAIWPVPRD